MKLKILFITIFLIFLGFLWQFCSWLNYQKEIEKQISYCRKNPDIDYRKQDSCFCKMYNLLLPRLIIYKAYNNFKPLKLLIETWNPYIVPEIALEKADAIIGYGAGYEIQFEDHFSMLYDKPAYAFDCGVQGVKFNSKKCHFESECIGTDEFILHEKGQVSSGKMHSFENKLKQLNLTDKKVYLKMDIAGAESEVIPDILKFKDNITGISLVIHYKSSKDIIEDTKILKMLERDFVLIARNNHHVETYINTNCKYCDYKIAKAITLSYINKNLVDFKYIPFNQNNNRPKDLENHYHKEVAAISFI